MVLEYRKKPVVIEAIQFDGMNIPEINQFVGKELEVEAGYYPGDLASEIASTSLLIKTLEGTMRADMNDYIVKGVKGEFYPCKPDIFEETYVVNVDNVIHKKIWNNGDKFKCFQKKIILNETSVAIDICLLPLIEKLWNNHIGTYECCCGHGGQNGYILVKADANTTKSTLKLCHEFGYHSAHVDWTVDNEEFGILAIIAIDTSEIEHEICESEAK